MCSVKQASAKAAAPEPTLPPLLAPTEAVDSSAAAAQAANRQKTAYGRSKTILTGSGGDTSAYKAEKKTLLGL